MKTAGRLGAAAAGAVMVVVAWALPARSQDDPAAFRQTIEGWLAAANARTGGPIAVRADAGALVATLPDVVVAAPDATLRLGTITIARSVAPGGRQRYEAALPREIRTERPSETSTITIDDGSVAVEVDPRTNIAHRSEGRFRNLAVQSSADPTRVSIALAEFAAGFTARADGLSDSPTRLRVQGLRVEMPPTRQSVAIGEIVMIADLRGFRLSDYEPLHIATRSAMASGDPRDLSRAIEQWLVFPFATMPIELSIADFVYGDGGATPAVTVARVTFGQTFESLANPETGYRVRYAHQGVAVRDDVTPFTGLIPSSIAIELAVAGMPSAEVRDALTNGLETGAVALDSFWTDMLDVLLTSAIDNAATLRVAPLELDAPMLGVSASANVTGNDRSPLSAVGTADIAIRGLEDAARAFAMLYDPQGSGQDSAAAGVAIIAAIGQAGTDPSGRPTRSYHIEIDEQGRMMLNGNDLSALLGGGPPPTQPAPSPAPGPAPGK